MSDNASTDRFNGLFCFAVLQARRGVDIAELQMPHGKSTTPSFPIQPEPISNLISYGQSSVTGQFMTEEADLCDVM